MITGFSGTREVVYHTQGTLICLKAKPTKQLNNKTIKKKDASLCKCHLKETGTSFIQLLQCFTFFSNSFKKSSFANWCFCQLNDKLVSVIATCYLVPLG